MSIIAEVVMYYKSNVPGFADDIEQLKYAWNHVALMFDSFFYEKADKEILKDTLKEEYKRIEGKVPPIHFLAGMDEFKENYELIREYDKSLQTSLKEWIPPCTYFAYKDLYNKFMELVGTPENTFNKLIVETVRDKNWETKNTTLEDIFNVRNGDVSLGYKFMSTVRKLINCHYIKNIYYPYENFTKRGRLLIYKSLSSYSLIFKYLQILGIPFTELEKRKMEVAEIVSRNSYMVFHFKNACFVIEKPKYKFLERRSKRQIRDLTLHNERGSAIIFPDKSHFSFFRSQPISNWYWDMKPSQKKALRILKTQNTTLRSMGIRYMGKDNLLKYLERKVLDKKQNYQLIAFQIPQEFEYNIKNPDWYPFLQMINPTTGEEHLEGVHKSCKTVEEALNWRLGLKVYDNPVFEA